MRHASWAGQTLPYLDLYFWPQNGVWQLVHNLTASLYHTWLCVHSLSVCALLTPAVAATTSVNDNIYQKLSPFFCFSSASPAYKHTLATQSTNVVKWHILPCWNVGHWTSEQRGICSLVCKTDFKTPADGSQANNTFLIFFKILCFQLTLVMAWVCELNQKCYKNLPLWLVTQHYSVSYFLKFLNNFPSQLFDPK